MQIIMKTLEAFVKEINESEELKNALKEIKDKDSLEAFLKKNGCDATAKEFAEFAKSQGEGEIGDDVAAAVSGGSWWNPFSWFC